MLFERGIKMAAQHDLTGCINGLYGKWLMITLQFSCLHAGKPSKSYYLIKLTRSNLFRLYFIKKSNWGGGLMERYLREVIGN